MKLIIISGRSGSGKSTALKALEDAGYNCIDNFPVNLLGALVAEVATYEDAPAARMAVCIDARNRHLERFPELLKHLDREHVDCQVVYLDAQSPTLVKRFSETRRRHPLTNQQTDLQEAIDTEVQMLASIADLSDLTIDTTLMSGQNLVEVIKSRVIENTNSGLNLLFKSFGFKYGVPMDADVVFDLRCLPNPFWVEDLRGLTGLEREVEAYLDGEDLVSVMFDDICAYLERWLPHFEANNRVYMTVAIGCTGGQHRSVYMAERLAGHFEDLKANIQVRHRELNQIR
ncbi:MAG: RNase adapter RapZ [Proteobacteria bacterium]|nr:RNase adapter RapZ [Pseudomonadota bacterium]